LRLVLADVAPEFADAFEELRGQAGPDLTDMVFDEFSDEGGAAGALVPPPRRR